MAHKLSSDIWFYMVWIKTKDVAFLRLSPALINEKFFLAFVIVIVNKLLNLNLNFSFYLYYKRSLLKMYVKTYETSS